MHGQDPDFGLIMATVVTEKLSQLFINVKQLPQLLGPLSPATVSSSEVPPVFWKPYIHGGYRPVRQTWRYYFSTLFQQHNEAINVWSHLAAALVLLLRFQRLWQRVDFGQDEHARPLLIILAASITYLTFSSLAHLLQAKSEFWHYSFFFMDYVGVAVYQYGSALGHFYYAIEPSWHERVRLLPAGGGGAGLAVLRRLLLRQVPLPPVLPAARPAVPGAALGPGLPAGHQPRGPSHLHLGAPGPGPALPQVPGALLPHWGLFLLPSLPREVVPREVPLLRAEPPDLPRVPGALHAGTDRGRGAGL